MRLSTCILGTMLVGATVPPPVEIARDSNGRFSVSLATGHAEFESKHFGCDGELLSAYPVHLDAAGIRMDYRPDGSAARVTVFMGALGSSTPDPCTQDYGGAFGGVQVAREGEHLGLGIGWAHVSGESGFDAPSTYLRLGDVNGGYLRIDVLPPDETLGVTGFARVGMGFNLGNPRKPGGLVGLAVAPYSYSELLQPRLFGDFRVPVAPRADLLLGAQVGAGAERTQWATRMGLGLRF